MNAPQEHSLYSQDTPDNQQDHREHQEKQTRKGTGMECMNINNTAYKTRLAGWGDGSLGKVFTHENPSSDS